MRLLFTGAGGAGNEAIWKILSKDYSVYFADANIENISNSIPKNRKIKILPAKNKNFLNNIKKVLKNYNINILVPGVDEELLKLTKLKSNKKNFKILMPNDDFIKKMINKYNCFEYLKNTNVKIPKIFTNKSKISFPIIAKPVIGRGSRFVEKLNNKNEINVYKKFYKLEKKKILLQKFIYGTEYTVFVFSSKKQKILNIIPVKIIKKKGITIEGITLKNRKIENYVKNFDKKFNANGPYNLQCIQKKNGEIFLIEVNPRISTTFCLILKSGFKFKQFINPNPKKIIFKEKIKLKRNWKNFFC